MFTNAQRQVERTGRHGTPRDQHLQNLVAQFQNSTDEESKERIVANLANFAYDPYNYAFISQSQVKGLLSSALVESVIHVSVDYALGALYYLCNPSTKKEILKPDVLRVLREYAAAGDVNTSFNNLANVFLDKHVNS